MAKKKTEHKRFTIMQHEEEQAYLREMHKHGWKFLLVTGLGTYHFEECEPEDVVYLSGGDGTLNHFANDLHGYCPKNQIYYVKSGSGNDFYHDSEGDVKDGMIHLNRYLENLPVITVNGMKRYFLNGIGGSEFQIVARGMGIKIKEVHLTF